MAVILEDKSISRFAALLLILTLFVRLFPTVLATESGDLEDGSSAVTLEGAAEETSAEEAETTENTPNAGIISNDVSAIVAEWEIFGGAVDFCTLFLNRTFDFTFAGYSQTKSHIPLYAVNLQNQGGYADGYHVAYCLEPGISLNYGVYQYGSSFTLGDLTEYSTIYSRLTRTQVEAISVALLYGATEIANKNDAEDVRLACLRQHAATQAIVWEIACGFRSELPPYARLDSRIYDTIAEKVMITSVVLDATFYISGIEEAYAEIENKMVQHNTVPSFSSAQEAQAPTYEMTITGEGTYTVTLTDTNNILDQYTFEDTANISFHVDGDEITVIATAEFPGEMLISPVKNVPNLDNQVFFVWENGNGQRLMSCKSTPIAEPVPCFFKLSIPSVENIILEKTTEDGLNLDGWLFGIYSDVDCTDLISGPHVTDQEGSASVTGLGAGTVYVKELGHVDPDIDARYTCIGNNPQEVVLAQGETVTVNFHNNLRDGQIAIKKVDSQGNALAGAKFLLEWSKDGVVWEPVTVIDAEYPIEGGCSSEGLLNGELTTGDDGLAVFSGLSPNLQYRLSEVKAPSGYQLLTDYAFIGELPEDQELTLTLTVVNAPGYALPMTGSKSFDAMAVTLCICIDGCLGALVHLRRKDR